jgi:ArsR family transcriptional regulator, arsenate/arsenite/antimonite-responsive transcriptional repressor
MRDSFSEQTSLKASPLLSLGFHALSEPLRLQIIALLQAQELCVCDLCDRLQISQSKLSFHLKTLKDAEIVRSRQSGRWIYYSLNLPQIAKLEQYLSDIRRSTSIAPSIDCP